MQTNFAPALLEDPDMAMSESILRKCVHCGFCTATCPTYVTLGNELDSPRGRIYLIKDMLENDRPADERTVTHIDRCLSCLACVTTCPSGVDYMHLVDHARAHIAETYKRPAADRAIRDLLARTLSYRGRFRAALTAAKLGKPFAGLMRGPLKPFEAMLKLAPAKLAPKTEFTTPGRSFPAKGRAAGPRRDPHRLRAARAGRRHQPRHHLAAHAPGHRGRASGGRRLLRCSRPPYGP